METRTGLGNENKSNWPVVSASELAKRPIERLKPGSELHGKVLAYLKERIDMSEREMCQFYNRWRVQERKIQAYISLSDWEQQLKEQNQDKGKAPKVISVTVPYAFATVSTIVTYLIHTFCGRKPMFQVGSYKKETMGNAQMMELVLQYNADYTRLIRHLFQFFFDGEVYGLGVLQTKWKNTKAFRTVRKKNPIWGFMDRVTGMQTSKTREERTVYSGNDVRTIDPFMFFPDPRVPMSEVNRRGEFVFWRSFEGKHSLKLSESRGEIRWVDAIQTQQREDVAQQESVRNLLSGGTSHPGLRVNNGAFWGGNYYQIDQGTVEIIPKELGLGSSEKPEKWIFAIANSCQIIQAEPFHCDHNMHPVAIIEPYSLGYGFGQPGSADYLSPIQDTLSWLVNSHISNVRSALNNMIIVDPTMVEMQDLKNPDAGKLIRLKQAAYGKDVRSVLSQLSIVDVTQNHMRDFELFMRMGDSMTGVNDNIRGLQDASGRKTATEVRTSGEAAASRLAAHTRKISAQGIVDLTEQQVLNIQQYMDDEFYVALTGLEGMKKPINIKTDEYGGIAINPEMLIGDFHFPIHDGTLPMDRVAMLDVWKEIFLAVAQDQQLRSTFNVVGIFEHIADLGGAKNLDKFKVNMNVAPPGAEMPQGAMPIPTGTSTTGIVSNPGDRLAGAI